MRLALLAAAAVFGATAAVAGDTPLSDAERAAVRQEVRAYLLENPEILNEMVSALDARRQAETAAADQALVADNSDTIFADGFSFEGGNPEGSVTVVEFLDYQCGFCRRASPDIARLIESDGDIRWVVKELPILGPGSELGARAAIATLRTAGPAAYADLNKRLLALKGPIDAETLDQLLGEAGMDAAAIKAGMSDPEVDRRLAATRDLAETLKITGTPTFVVGREMLRGAVPLADMASLVDAQRTAAE